MGSRGFKLSTDGTFRFLRSTLGLRCPLRRLFNAQCQAQARLSGHYIGVLQRDRDAQEVRPCLQCVCHLRPDAVFFADTVLRRRPRALPASTVEEKLFVGQKGDFV